MPIPTTSYKASEGAYRASEGYPMRIWLFLVVLEISWMAMEVVRLSAAMIVSVVVVLLHYSKTTVTEISCSKATLATTNKQTPFLTRALRWWTRNTARKSLAIPTTR